MQIVDTDNENILELGICGYTNPKRQGYHEKILWIEKQKQYNLTIKTLFSSVSGTQGMIEYIPGQYCWRPVDAQNHMFIHCLFVGHRKEYKNRGYGTALIQTCINDAKKQNMPGVAVVTRKGSFMTNKDIYLKNKFEIIETSKPDFQLLALTFKNSRRPSFINKPIESYSEYKKGLSILRADQCPYTVKNVEEIISLLEKDYCITPKLVNLNSYQKAQKNPCPFGTFAIIYEGQIIAHHPISKKRFSNIMDKILT